MAQITNRIAVLTSAALVVVVLATACAQTDVNVTRTTLSDLAEPDRVLVRNFAVTRSEVELDGGIAPTLWRDVSGEAATAEEQKVGHAAAEALADELVKSLVDKGIPAARADRGTPLSPTTAVVVGRFVTLDEGNQTARTLIGFGLGGSEVRTQVRVHQAGMLIAEADTMANSGYKPGAGVTMGAGAAVGSAAVAAGVAAGTTTVSEVFMTSVEVGARRTAREIADKIEEAYKKRGWLDD
jgi:hypothetical protein